MHAKKNPKKFWAYVNSKAKYKSDTTELIESSTGKLTNGCTERAETLSKYFSSVFTVEPENVQGYSCTHSIKKSLSTITITEDQVLHKLLDIDCSKSPGPDNVHPRILKEMAHELSGILTSIFNTSIQSGQLPEEWKLADITAIFKKGDRCLPEN